MIEPLNQLNLYGLDNYFNDLKILYEKKNYQIKFY